VKAAVLPRLLAPGKAAAGGQLNFERFTGFPLVGTSMGLSLLGEGYANYGVTGACLFLFLVGLVYSGALQLLFLIARRQPTVILWIPLIFLHVVKAESELLVTLNHLVKASVFVALFLWGGRLLLGRRI
jgi:hypothetical protein